MSVFGSTEELQHDFKALSCGGLFINQAPEDSSLPSAGMGFNSNITNGGSDILTQLSAKSLPGMDAITEPADPEKAAVVESDPSKMVTPIEEDSSDEDYADW